MKNVLVVFLILLLGLLFRLPFILVSPYQVDYDNCTIGLMARHILQGKFPVFFYGQPYMGSIEAFVVSIGFLLFGQSGYTLLFSVLSFYVLFIICIYYLGILIGGRKAGLYAILYLSFGPCYFLIHTYAPRGGYIETLLFGTLLLIISIKIAKAPRQWLYLLLGFVSGLAFWTHFLIIYYLLAIGLFLGRRLRLKAIISTGISFFAGSLPFWIYNIKNGFPSLMFKGAVGGGIDPGKVLQKLVFIDLRGLLGFEYVDIGWFNYIILAVYLVVFLVFFYKRAGSWLLVLFFLSTISIYTTNAFALLHTHKYLLPIFSFIPIGIGFVSSLLDRYKRFLGLSVMAVVISFNITGSTKALNKWIPEIRQDERLYKGILEFCNRNGINRIITPHWDSYTIAFFSGEKIICSRVRDERILDYAHIVERADNIAILSYPGDEISSSLNSIGCSYKDINFGRYSIWYDIRVPNYRGREISPVNWTLKSNYGADLVDYSIDRNIDFTWTSLTSKKDDMWFLLDIGRVYKIFKIVIYNGENIHNYPGSCRIEVSRDGVEWDVVQEVKDKEPIYTSGPRIYWQHMYERWEVIFNPKEARYIRLNLMDNDEIHPWEINELFVYEYIGAEDIDYKGVIPKLAEFLRLNNIGFVYTDFWLSARLKEYNIRTLNPYLERYPRQEDTKRDVILHENMAFIVEDGEARGVEEILSTYNIPFKKNPIGYYMVYCLNPEPGLIWAGRTLLKGNLKDRSWYLYERGEEFVKSGDLDKGIRYFREAITCYRNNLRALYRLIELGEDGLYSEYRLRTEPEIKADILFEKDIEFLGFGTEQSGDVITIDYYWRIKRPIQEKDLFVYMHFIKDKEIVFQNDHPFLQHYPRHLPPFSNEIFWERYKMDIPKGCEKGDYIIRIGIWNKGTGERFRVKRGQASFSLQIQ